MERGVRSEWGRVRGEGVGWRAGRKVVAVATGAPEGEVRGVRRRRGKKMDMGVRVGEGEGKGEGKREGKGSGVSQKEVAVDKGVHGVCVLGGGR